MMVEPMKILELHYPYKQVSGLAPAAPTSPDIYSLK